MSTCDYSPSDYIGESQQRPGIRLWALEAHEMPRLGDDLDAGVRDASPEDLGIRGRHEPIVRTPHDERGRGDARQALLEAVLRNREEELRRGTEAAHQSDQELHLLVRAVVLVADEARH